MALFAGLGGIFLPIAQMLAIRLFSWHCWMKQGSLFFLHMSLHDVSCHFEGSWFNWNWAVKAKEFVKGCACQANPEALQVHLCGLWSPEPHRNGGCITSNALHVVLFPGPLTSLHLSDLSLPFVSQFNSWFFGHFFSFYFSQAPCHFSWKVLAIHSALILLQAELFACRLIWKNTRNMKTI